jgi:hypothetical protein
VAKILKTVPKYKKAEAIAIWLDASSTRLREALTDMIGVADQMYWQWTSGRRGISAETAGKIDTATRYLAKNRGAPKPVLRGDICTACEKCHYFQEHPEVVARNKEDDLA